MRFSFRFSALDSVTLDRTNRYEVRTAKPVRGQVRQKGGSDPIFSPGLRPEKQHGVAPALSCLVMLFVLARMSTAASKYKLNRTVHRSPRNIVQVGRAFFLCRILPTSCPLVEIEGDFPSRTPTPLYKNRREESKRGCLSFESKHEEGQIQLFETKKS